MKVIHITSHLKMGGAETLITNYALKINKNKFEFIIITLGGRNNSFNEEKLEYAGIKVIYLGDEIKKLDNKKIINRMINKFNRYRVLRKYIKELKPNIIHSHLSVNEYIMFINTKGIKLYHTLHNEIRVLFRKEKWLYKISTHYCIKYKHMIPIALHSKMKKESDELFSTDKSIIVYNGIDVNSFKNIKVNKVIKKEAIGLKENAYVVGHIGRFVEQKNHMFLIDVFEKVKQKNNNAHLILVGVGELLNQVQDKIKLLSLEDSVTLLGTRSDIAELMHIMDVFVFPSLYEGFGNVLLEAQASGIRCIVSNTIPKEVFVSDSILALGLDESTEKWSEFIIKEQIKFKEQNYLCKYDINNIVNELENHYLEVTT